jgi:hypothetical protein
MNTKIFTTFFLFAFFPILSFAQCNKLINIQVVDSKTRKPVPFVDVSIYDLSVVDAVFMQDKISDSNGIVIVPFKIYPDRIYKISAIKDGYRPAVENMINFLGDTFVMAIGAIIKKPSPRYIKIIGRESRLPLDSFDVSFYHIVNGDFGFVGNSMTDSNGMAKVPASFGTEGKVNANNLSFGHKCFWPAAETVRNFDSGVCVIYSDRMTDCGHMRIEDVYFAYDRANIVDFYKPIIDTVICILNQNPTFKIEVTGHTDNKEDSTTINNSLSQNRAQNVKLYMILRGLSSARIITKALGSSMPVVPNEKNGYDDPEGRAQNRRVEFRIISGEEENIPKIEYEKR